MGRLLKAKQPKSTWFHNSWPFLRSVMQNVPHDIAIDQVVHLQSAQICSIIVYFHRVNVHVLVEAKVKIREVIEIHIHDRFWLRELKLCEHRCIVILKVVEDDLLTLGINLFNSSLCLLTSPHEGEYQHGNLIILEEIGNVSCLDQFALVLLCL